MSKFTVQDSVDVRDIVHPTGEALSSTKRGLHVIPESAGVPWDNIAITYPSATTEVFTYTLLAVVKRVITLTYSDSTKTVLTNVARV